MENTGGNSPQPQQGFTDVTVNTLRDYIDMVHKLVHSFLQQPLAQRVNSLWAEDIVAMFGPESQSKFFTAQDRSEVYANVDIARWLLSVLFVDISAVLQVSLLDTEDVERKFVGKLNVYSKRDTVNLDNISKSIFNEEQHGAANMVHVRAFVTAVSEFYLGPTEQQMQQHTNSSRNYGALLIEIAVVLGSVIETLHLVDAQLLEPSWLPSNRPFMEHLLKLVQARVESNVVVYLKLRNDEEYEWNRRYYPFVGWTTLQKDTPTTVVMKYDDEHNEQPYYQFGHDLEVQSTELANQKVAGQKEYSRKYVFGPFSRVFWPEESNAVIARQMDAITTHLKKGRVVFVMGYGASGAGKTSTLVQLTRKGKRQPGVLLEICKLLGKDYNQLTVSAKEFYSLDGKTHTVQDVTEMKFTYSASDDGYLLSTSQTFQNLHPKKVGNLEESITFHGNSPLGDVLLHIVDVDRFVKATPNNPNSSRSHTLVFLKFKKGDDSGENPLRLVIGDFAGVENAFDCANKWEDFATIRRNGEPDEKPFYSDEVLGTRQPRGGGPRLDVRDNSDQGISLVDGCQVPYIQTVLPPFRFDMSAAEHEQWLRAKEASGLNDNLVNLTGKTAADWLKVIGGYYTRSNDSTDAVNTLSQDLDFVAGFIQHKRNGAPHPALAQWAHDAESLLASFNQAEKDLGEFRSWVNQVFGAGYYVYGPDYALDKSLPKSYYLTFLDGAKPQPSGYNPKNENSTNSKQKNEKNLLSLLQQYTTNQGKWAPFVTYLKSKVDQKGNTVPTKIWEKHLDQHGLMTHGIDFLNLGKLVKYHKEASPAASGPRGGGPKQSLPSRAYRTPLTANPYAQRQPSKPSPESLLSSIISGTYATSLDLRTGKVGTEPVKTYRDIRNRSEQRYKDLLVSWGLTATSLQPDGMDAVKTLLELVRDRLKERQCRKEYLKQVCERRRAEGVYINTSLRMVREYIRWNIAKSNEGAIDLLPLYFPGCLRQYCVRNEYDCFRTPAVTSEQPPKSEIFEAIRDVMGVGKPSDLLICVFTVLNLTRSKSQDMPSIPYVDVNLLKRFHARSWPSKGLVDRLTKIQDEIKRVMGTLRKGLVNPKVIAQLYAKWNELPDVLTPDNISQLRTSLGEFLQAIDNNNALTPIGTLEFADAVAKYSTVRVSCQQARPQRNIETTEWTRPSDADFAALSFQALEVHNATDASVTGTHSMRTPPEFQTPTGTGTPTPNLPNPSPPAPIQSNTGSAASRPDSATTPPPPVRSTIPTVTTAAIPSRPDSATTPPPPVRSTIPTATTASPASQSRPTSATAKPPFRPPSPLPTLQGRSGIASHKEQLGPTENEIGRAVVDQVKKMFAKRP
jgi:hypothetical protein